MNDSKSAPEHFVARHIAELPKSGIRKFFDLASTMTDVVSLGVGEPDFVTPWHIRESAVTSLEKGHTAYTSNLGLLSLRREICSYLQKNYHLSYDPARECLVSVGVSEALDAVMRAIINPGDEIIYAEPCFVSYPAEIRMAHGTPVPVPTSAADGFALNPETLRKVITPRSKALLMNFPCNPTGAVLEEPALSEIARIACEHDLLVITDEIYSELTFEGEHRSIASLPGMRDRTIFLHGFSKAFAMTGWRIGYACGPAGIIDAAMKVHQYAIMCAPTMAQEAALEALRRGRREMERMRDSYRERRDLLVNHLNRIGLKCLLPKGTFYAFPDVTGTGLSSADFAERLLKKNRVAVVPGNAFGASGEGYVRCCYAAGVREILTAVERMDKFLNS